MSMVSIDHLVRPVSPEAPCGEDVSELTEYYVLEDLVAGATQSQGAGTGGEAQWPRVLDAATELLQRGKELRIAVHLTHALLRLDGFAGLRDGLQLLARLLAEQWEGLFPPLDAGEDNPAMARMNMLRELSAGAAGGESVSRFVAAVRETPICDARQAGRFTWREVLMATGEVPVPAGAAAPAIALIDGAIRDTDPVPMAARVQALAESIETLSAMDRFLSQTLGTNNTAQIAKLGSLLGLILGRLRSALSSGGPTPAAGPAAATAAASPMPLRGAGIGTVTCQGDVVKALDAICAWYEANEKSSPVPYLLRRAKRLVGQDFMGIVKDVARNAEEQVTELFGNRDGGT